MKKILCFLLILCLSGCTDTAVTEITTTESTIAEAAIPETTTATQPKPDFSGFSLADYYPTDTSVKPLSFKIENSMEIYDVNNEKLELALAELKKSEYYIKATEMGRKYFAYENGEYIIIPENESFATETFLDYFDVNAEPFTIKPQLAQTINTEFDGENAEAVFSFILPLCTELPHETSSFTTYCITVYVNSRNEAILLNDGSAQTLTDVTPIFFENGEVHLLFSWGHTMGSSASSIISFENGVPKTEYYGSKVIMDLKTNLFHALAAGNFNIYSLFFRDKKMGYCNVSGAVLDGEALEIICSSEKVRENIPSIAECKAIVFGGKYISTGSMMFSFEKGEFIVYDDLIISPDDTLTNSYSISID